MNALEMEVVKAAINKMMTEGHFSICTIDACLKLTGGIPPEREYQILRTLHCVDYEAMSPRLRIELPRLIQIVLESQPLRSPFDPAVRAIELSPDTFKLLK